MSFSDAVQREVDWLSDVVSGFPPLLAEQGGPFDTIDAYGSLLERSPDVIVHPKTLVVCRDHNAMDLRFAIQQRHYVHALRLELQWPLAAPGLPEVEFALVDQALEDILTRTRGTFMDHTHGGRFESVAEGFEGDGTSGPARIDIDIDDYRTAVANAQITARVTYVAVDVPSVI